jgi:hypothetical protein
LACKFQRYLVLALMVLLGQAPCHGQATFFLESGLGYGTFHMREMKDLQQFLIKQVPVGVKVTDNFPGFYQFSLRGARNLENAEAENVYLGLVAETGSTGGRAHYADYSGHIVFDQLLRYYSGGIFVEKITYHHPIYFFYGLQLEALYTRLNFISQVKVGDQDQAESETFGSLGGGLKPYLGVAYPFRQFSLGLHLGFLVNGSAPFHLKGEPRAVISLEGPEAEVSPGWSGVRLNLTARYFLKI